MATSERYGIDVSQWQGEIDWARVAGAGIQFAILRCTSGRSNRLDSQFQANLEGCATQRIPIGVYRYGYATSATEAEREAQAVAEAIQGYAMPCRVWYDVENSTQRALPSTELTSIIRTFAAVIEDAGYAWGIYCNQDWYDNVLDADAFDCPFWIARYGANDGKMHTRPSVHHTLWGWQYTSRGSVDGISGGVDLDVMYADPENGNATIHTTTVKGGFDVSTLSTIKSGSAGAQVKSLQSLLNGKAGAGLSVDGDCGSKTVAAVKAYQTAKGLTADGICGAKTWTALLTK